MTYSGAVIRKPIAAGSKSAHAAVILDTGSEQFVLRRVGGNPFSDPTLEQLVGQKITFDGSVRGYTLFVDRWQPLDGRATAEAKRSAR
jgi:hypothetical protein